MTKVKDKVFWITGASSGIGEALTKRVIKKGGKVIASARRINELQLLSSQCELKKIVLFFSFDLSVL